MVNAIVTSYILLKIFIYIIMIMKNHNKKLSYMFVKIKNTIHEIPSQR